MNLSSLIQLVTQGESETLEFKHSTGQRTDGAKTACAMLNGLGGFVLFGVSNRGELVGQTIGTETLEDIAREVARFEPAVKPDAEVIALDNGKAVLALRLTGGGGPYTYDGRPYVRVGTVTRVMPRQHYERLLLEHMHAAHRWENQPAYGIGVEDLDQQEIILTIEEAIRRQRLDDPATRNPTALLAGLNLLHEGHLLNAAVVLFGKANRLLPNYPQCLLRLARFRGHDKTEFVDNRQEVGNAFELLIRAQRFLRDHLPVAGRIVPTLFERVDDPLYPPAALREALANALCHRDYSIGGGAVSIAIYDDRLEISSTGTLPFGLTPDDLSRPHQSRPWNPIIAHAFYRRGIIESWGRGTIKMIELTEQAGLTPPEFECSGGEVLVRFRPTRYVPPTRVGHNLSTLQQDLLAVLAQIGPARLSHIHSILSKEVPERTVQNNLQMLRSLGLIDLTGSGRARRWTLKYPDNKV